jgi:hypothetical protein
MAMTLLNMIAVIPGLFLISLNWYWFWLGFKKERSPSCFPLLGGVMLALGILVLPHPYPRWFWLGFVIDYGCLPAIISICREIRKQARDRNNSPRLSIAWRM